MVFPLGPVTASAPSAPVVTEEEAEFVARESAALEAPVAAPIGEEAPVAAVGAGAAAAVGKASTVEAGEIAEPVAKEASVAAAGVSAAETLVVAAGASAASVLAALHPAPVDRKSTRLNSSHWS